MGDLTDHQKRKDVKTSSESHLTGRTQDMFTLTSQSLVLTYRTGLSAIRQTQRSVTGGAYAEFYGIRPDAYSFPAGLVPLDDMDKVLATRPPSGSIQTF